MKPAAPLRAGSTAASPPPLSGRRTTDYWSVIALCAALVTVGVVYLPGLQGPFRLDDVANLSLIGSWGGVRDIETLALYVTSGFADPTGRPVSMLSFLVDSTTWPADPWPFKRTNLLIHLVNAALLFLLLKKWEMRIGSSGSESSWIAAIAAALWAAHPLWTSSVLYVVQRQAMLPLTFGLLAMLLWERQHTASLTDRRERATRLTMAAAAATCLLLAVLSKPNGILLAPAMLFIHGTLRRDATPPQDPTTKAIRTVILWLPTSAFVLLASLTLSLGLDQQGSRPWTLGQRLLTEPAILFDYLARILLPRPTDPSIFEDHWQAATSLWSPWYTFAAICGVLVLAAAPVLMRARYPRLSIAIATFLICHLMESGPFMLELAFEHRNYLPAVFLTWPLAAILVRSSSPAAARSLIAMALLVALLLPTAESARRWGDAGWVNPESATHAANSPRTAFHWASQLAATQGTTAAKLAVSQGVAWHPNDLNLALLQAEIECASGFLEASSADHLQRQLSARLATDPGAFEHWMRFVADPVTRSHCEGLTHDQVNAWVDAAESNPLIHQYPAHRQALLRAKGKWQLAIGDEAGVEAIRESVEADLRPASLFIAVSILAESGRQADALALVERFPPNRIYQSSSGLSMRRLHDSVMFWSGRLAKEHEHLRRLLTADLEASAASG